MLTPLAAQPDIRPEAHHRPVGPAARVGLPQPDDITHVDFDEFGGAHVCPDETPLTPARLQRERG